MIKIGTGNHKYISKIEIPNDNIDDFYDEDVEDYPISDREPIGEATEETRKQMERDIKYEHGRS